MRLTARSIVVEVLSVASTGYMPALRVGLIIESCALFGFTSNTVRVALAKMRAEGMVVSTQRGLYALGPAAHPVNDQVLGWREAGRKTIAWDLSWVAANTGHMPRSDRPEYRRRVRALKFLGFRELAQGLHLRPNNLEAGVVGVRQKLARLGLEDAIVTRLDELSAQDDERARNLWDTDAIVAQCHAWVGKLSASRAKWQDQPLTTTTREAYLLGREVIRAIVLDPLLPEPLVASESREKLIEAMSTYSNEGLTLWRRYLGVDSNHEPRELGTQHDGTRRKPEQSVLVR
ncbi:MAG: hypothetical protein WBG86_11595 [Polyangiales bacterium]